MTSPIIIAQVGGMATGTGGNAPRDIKLVKPQGNQALAIALDGTVRLDFSAIANENLTLVHIGDRLIILFDNHAQVTLAGDIVSRDLQLPVAPRTFRQYCGLPNPNRQRLVEADEHAC